MNAIRVLNGIAIATTLLLVTFAGQQGAQAQTAKDVVCKGCVGKKDLGKKSVRKKHIKDNAVQTQAIQDGAITSEKVEEGSITAAHLAEDAVRVGVAEGPVNEYQALTNTEAAVAEIIVQAPSTGYILAAAHWFFYGTDGATVCGLSKETTSIPDDYVSAGWNGTGGYPSSTMRFFEVTEGPNTVNLVCKKNAGTAVVQRAKLNAIFVPQAY